VAASCCWCLPVSSSFSCEPLFYPLLLCLIIRKVVCSLFFFQGCRFISPAYHSAFSFQIQFPLLRSVPRFWYRCGGKLKFFTIPPNGPLGPFDGSVFCWYFFFPLPSVKTVGRSLRPPLEDPRPFRLGHTPSLHPLVVPPCKGSVRNLYRFGLTSLSKVSIHPISVTSLKQPFHRFLDIPARPFHFSHWGGSQVLFFFLS